MSTRWSPLAKQIVIIGSVPLSLWLVVRARQILAPLVIALLLAYLMSFPVNRLIRHGVSRTLATLLAEIVVLLLLASAPAMVVPRLVALTRSFAVTLLNVVQELLEVTPKPVEIVPNWTIDLGPYYAPISAWLRSIVAIDQNGIPNMQALLQPVADQAAILVRGAVSGISWLVLIFVVSFYVVRDGQRLARSLCQQIPAPWQPELSQLWSRLVALWDSFVRGQLVLGIVMGVVVWLAMSILGVRSAPALGLLSGILEFIPAVGPVIAAIPGVLIALMLGSTWLPLPPLGFAILVLLVYVLLQQLENIFLLPKIVGRRVSLHPAAVIIGALAGWQIAGVLGILLAAPALACGRILADYAAKKLLDQEPFPAPEVAPHDGEQFWRSMVQSRPVTAVLFDIDGTLVETDDRLEQELSARLVFLHRFFSEATRRHFARRLMMRSENFVNGFISLLDLLHLDRPFFRLRRRLMRWRGVSNSEKIVPVAGVTEMLAALSKLGYSLAIVTSRDRSETGVILDRLGVKKLFSAVVTREDVRRMKPHPMAVQLAAKLLDTGPEHCVMVGDTGVDVRAAKAAGALAVGVLCGFGEKADFGDADLTIASTDQLLTWL